MHYFDIYRGLPKSIYVLFFAQVINRFGDFVLPFLTLLLVKKLGLTYQMAGLAVMSATLCTIPGAFAGGKLADHYGRKRTYLLFQSSAALALLACTFTSSPQVIVPLVCISAFFNGGVRPCLTAIVTDVLPPEKRQLGFSLSYLGINFGVALGPMVAGFLFNHNYHLIFIGDAITSAVAIALMATQIKETMPVADSISAKSTAEGSQVKSDHKKDNQIEADQTTSMEGVEEGTVFHVLFRRPQILIFLLINVVISMTYTQHSFSLPMMMDHVFGADGAQMFGYIMSVNAVTVLVLTAVVTQHSKQNHPLINMSIASLTYAVGFGVIGMIHQFPLFILSTVLWTIGEILIVTNFSVYVANNTPQNYRARFNAVTSLSWAGGAALGTSGVGMYMDVYGISAVWPLTFVAGIFTLICLLLLKKNTAELSE